MYKHLHLILQMARLECGKNLLSNNTHIIYYQKGNVWTCDQFPCQNMYKHLVHLPEIVIMCGKMDLS